MFECVLRSSERSDQDRDFTDQGDDVQKGEHCLKEEGGDVIL